MDENSIEYRLAQQELRDALNQARALYGAAPLPALPEPPYCAFCGRPKEEAGPLAEGITAYIWRTCAEDARRALL